MDEQTQMHTYLLKLDICNYYIDYIIRYVQ